MTSEMEKVPGFLFFDHVAITVKPGELETQVKAYKTLGFREVHREDVLGSDQVREVLLQIGDGPNLVQLLEPLNAESPVAKQIEKNGGRGGMAHVALRVADIQNAFDHLKANGFKIIDKAPGERVARDHRLLRPSEDHRNGSIRLPDRSGPGGRPCLTMHLVPRSSASARIFRPCRPASGKRRSTSI